VSRVLFNTAKATVVGIGIFNILGKHTSVLGMTENYNILPYRVWDLACWW